MTVQTQTRRVIYTSDGVVTLYAFNFETYDVNWIYVFDDAEITTRIVEVILNPDQENSPGGTIEYQEPPPPDGDSITILRYVPVNQETDYTAYDSFPAETHEAALDKLTLISQQLTDATYRAIKVPIDSPEPGGGLPGDSIEVEIPEPGHALTWGPEGESIINSEYPIDLVTAVAQQSADDAAASAVESAASASQSSGFASDSFASADESANSAAESAASAALSASIFDEKLAGYKNDGTHNYFSGDLDTLLVNAEYQVHNDQLTNQPGDMDGTGFIIVHTSDNGEQILQEMIGHDSINTLWWRQSNDSGVIWSAWSKVIDPNLAGDTFLDRLLGYKTDGLHSSYAGDINTILVNSVYLVWVGDSISFPDDMTSKGILYTDFHDSNDTVAVQTLYGMYSTDRNKVWSRTKEDDVWTAWIKIIDGAKLIISDAGTFTFINVPTTQVAPTDNHHLTRKDYVDSGDSVNAGQASAAQGTADTALANAATADGKAVAAQGSADAAQGTADTANALATSNEGRITTLENAPPSSSIPAGSIMAFYMATAPSGWTINGSVNDAILRVVSANGGVQAGTNGFSTFNAQTATGAHAITEAEMPAHTHSYIPNVLSNFEGGPNALAHVAGGAIESGAKGGNGAHSHSMTTAIKYADFIIASKN